MPRYIPFQDQYSAECACVGETPLKWVTSSCPGELVVDVDRVTTNAWPPLIKSLSAATDVTKLCVLSSSGVHSGTSPHIRLLVEAVSDCICKSAQLSELDFIRIDLGHAFLLRSILSGLSRNAWLRHISFENCSLDDEAVDSICSAAMNRPNISHLSFSGRKITRAVAFAALLKHQQTVRRNAAERRKSQQSCKPVRFHGLTRLSLVDCPNVGSSGFRLIAESLFDSDHFKALDMINCGIDKRALSTLDALLSNNKSLVVLDMRANPITTAASDIVRQKLLILSQGTHKYPVLPTSHPWEPSARKSPVKEKPAKPLRSVPEGFEEIVKKGGDNPLDALLKTLVEEREARKKAEREAVHLRRENDELRSRVSRLEYLNGFTESTAFTVEDTLLRFQAFLDALREMRLEVEEDPVNETGFLDSVPVREEKDAGCEKSNSQQGDDYNDDTFESDSAS